MPFRSENGEFVLEERDIPIQRRHECWNWVPHQKFPWQKLISTKDADELALHTALLIRYVH